MYKRHPKLVKLWQKWTLWSICMDGTLTWFSSDDIHQRERKLDYEIQLPKSVWRPYCWKYGHEEYYRDCITCGKVLRPRKKAP